MLGFGVCVTNCNNFVYVGRLVLIFILLTNGLKKGIFKIKIFSELMVQKKDTTTKPWLQGLA